MIYLLQKRIYFKKFIVPCKSQLARHLYLFKNQKNHVKLVTGFTCLYRNLSKRHGLLLFSILKLYVIHLIIFKYYLLR